MQRYETAMRSPTWNIGQVGGLLFPRHGGARRDTARCDLLGLRRRPSAPAAIDWTMPVIVSGARTRSTDGTPMRRPARQIANTGRALLIMVCPGRPGDVKSRQPE